jgi:hypothetical protein
MDDCQQQITQKFDASTMESLERFRHQCSALQPNKVVEYGKFLMLQGCTLDFTDVCEDDDVGIIGLAGKTGVAVTGCVSFIATVTSCDDAGSGQQVRDLCPLTCGVCVSTVGPTPGPTPAEPGINEEMNPEVITNIVTSSTECMPVANRLTLDSQYYCDRDYVFTDIPTFLGGAVILTTANNDKQADPNDPDFLCFDISEPAAVYLLYDIQIPAPAWLTATFTDLQVRYLHLFAPFQRILCP